MYANSEGPEPGVIRVPRPQVSWVRRHRPGEVATGDSAQVRVRAGLIGVLEPHLDAGFAARYTIPVGVAATAALTLLQPAPGGFGWAGRELEVDWLGAASSSDTLIGEAQVTEFLAHSARFTIQGRTETGRALFTGFLSVTGLRDGRPAEFSTQAEYEAHRASRAAATESRTCGSLRVANAPSLIRLGRSAPVEMEVHNSTDQELSVVVEAGLPFGAGLSLDSPKRVVLQLGPGTRAFAAFAVRADRPDEVNLGEPWLLNVTAGSDSLQLPIAVPDPAPGRTFYLLTEDCETFDGGPLTGNYSGSEMLGNHNNFMDPEEYLIQMVQKPDRMNQIAERYGARWTHFYALTQRFAAEWAARQSRTGRWDEIVREMDRSIRKGSIHHEYCPHIHFDYEPDSQLAPQPRLIYDPATDGILPNEYYDPKHNPQHRYHDWDGAARGHVYVRSLGDWSDLDTKTGSLRKYTRHLARLAANRRSPIVARTGSYDFGATPEDQAISTRAYLANGLRGNSDVYCPDAGPRAGGEMFWCSETDRQQPIARLSDARLVQLRITRETVFTSTEEVNHWFAAEYKSCRGPGVHAILFTSHAMFMSGVPDQFRSLMGGGFYKLERHLDWVTRNYPDLEFATASEAITEYLDYYSPTLQCQTHPRVCGGDPESGRYIFPVRLLGRGIRVDVQHPATVPVTPPLCFSPEELLNLRLLQRGVVISETSGFDPRTQASISAALTSRDPLTLELQLRGEAIAPALEWFAEEGRVMFYEPPEPAGADLLHLHDVGDVVRFLMNPVAGHTEPLGRRVHPLGMYAVGAALTAAFEAAGSNVPAHLKLRWQRPLQDGMRIQTGAEPIDQCFRVQIRDDAGAKLAIAEVSVG